MRLLMCLLLPHQLEHQKAHTQSFWIGSPTHRGWAHLCGSILLLELQKQAASEDTPFFPDANSTLRLSAGHVEGYKAADAVYHTPITTLQGLIEKHGDAVLTRAEGPGEFECPERLVETARADSAVRAVPTNVLCKRSRTLFAF